ncbi:MAG: DNA polymerase III subunit, partial [Clostridia bacterium]|nr:DNA polymerase III subunit [Clostridia bacterium]
MNFSSLYGHESVKSRLGLAITQDKISNAYVFEGSDGVGKKLCARIFAQSLVCESKEPPCGVCKACIQAKAKTLPDIITVEKDADKTQIGVDNVREQVIAEVYLKPSFANRKIFIIEQGDILSVEAQNALLKVLEEPPEYVTFIICVTSKEKLLPTVLSRSQTVSFFPLSTETVEKYIKDNEKSDVDTKIIAKLSRGSIGTAKALISDDAKMARIEKSIQCILNLKKNALSVREMTTFLTEEKENITEILDFSLAFLRDCVLLKTDLLENIIFSDHLSDMR